MVHPPASDGRKVYADLHVHTKLSDGLDSPQEVVRKASEKGLKVIAITDHDTVVGVDQAIEAAEGTSLRIIPGIEMSTDEGKHLVGLFIDHESKVIEEFTRFMRKSRIEWAEKVLRKLEIEGIASLSLDSLLDDVGQGVVGKPHIAEMATGSSKYERIKEYIQVYLNRGMPAYVSKEKKSMEECIDIIIKAGGIPVLAHPWSEKATAFNNGDMDKMIAAGLKGIEIFYPDQDPEMIEQYIGQAEAMGLVISGGSDHHGNDRLGQYGVTEEEFQRLEDLI